MDTQNHTLGGFDNDRRSRVSRRAFVQSLGIGGAFWAAGVVVSARGREALVGAGLDPLAAEWLPRDPARAGVPTRRSSNENPNGPGPRALDAIQRAFDVSGRYPYEQAAQVTAAIAKHLGVAEENVLAGCGSGEVLRMAALAFTSPQKPLVEAAPTFEDPGRTARSLGHPVRAVPVDGQLRLDLTRMAEQADGAGLVFLCNPNNPTGTVHGAGAVADFIRAVNRRSPDTMILVDEAYHEYVADPAYKTSIELALENPRVIVSRTFSKIYGMAGLRLGYGVGQKAALDRLRLYRLANNVNVLAAAAGVATLGDRERVDREVRLNAEARAFARKAFLDWGYTCLPSETNFIFVDIRRDARDFQDACRKLNVLVGRPFPPLTTHARISIGTMDEMRQAVEVFRRVLG
jgi:histidinol-phosphate aminotransferase